MSWEIEVFDEFERGTLDGIVDRALSYMPDNPTPEQINWTISRAIDEECASYQPKLAVIEWTGFTSHAFDMAYEDLFAAIYDRIDFEEE